MANELTTLDSQQLKELVATLPAKKRAAFSKAAKAAIQHLKDSKANYSKAYDLASAMVENWWLLGLEVPKLGVSQGTGMKKRSAQGQNVFLLQDLGINEKQSQRCQKLAEKSKDELDEWLASKYNEGTYYLPTLRPASEAVHVSKNTGQPEWYTPPEFIEAARTVMGSIDLDPASSDKAQETVQAKEYMTINDDGLMYEWCGNVWLNPPYSSGVVDEFMLAVKEGYEAGKIKAAVTLTNNSTDTKWFQSCCNAASSLCLISGRVKFLDENGNPGAPLQGQAILYFGLAASKFVKEFERFGSTWTRS